MLDKELENYWNGIPGNNHEQTEEMGDTDTQASEVEKKPAEEPKEEKKPDTGSSKKDIYAGLHLIQTVYKLLKNFSSLTDEQKHHLKELARDLDTIIGGL